MKGSKRSRISTFFLFIVPLSGAIKASFQSEMFFLPLALLLLVAKSDATTLDNGDIHSSSDRLGIDEAIH